MNKYDLTMTYPSISQAMEKATASEMIINSALVKVSDWSNFSFINKIAKLICGGKKKKSTFFSLRKQIEIRNFYLDF